MLVIEPKFATFSNEAAKVVGMRKILGKDDGHRWKMMNMGGNITKNRWSM